MQGQHLQLSSVCCCCVFEEKQEQLNVCLPYTAAVQTFLNVVCGPQSLGYYCYHKRFYE